MNYIIEKEDASKRLDVFLSEKMKMQQEAI